MTTYYIDPVVGNNTWSGTLEVPTPTDTPVDGPKQTFVGIAWGTNNIFKLKCGTSIDIPLTGSIVMTGVNNKITSYGVGAKPIITGSASYPRVNMNAAGQSLEGLIINSSQVTNLYSTVLIAAGYATRTTITNCDFIGNAANTSGMGISVPANAVSSVGGMLIDGCTFTDMWRGVGHEISSASITQSNYVVRNCTFTNLDDYGIYFRTVTNWTTSKFTNLLIENNVLSDCGAGIIVQTSNNDYHLVAPVIWNNNIQIIGNSLSQNVAQITIEPLLAHGGIAMGACENSLIKNNRLIGCSVQGALIQTAACRNYIIEDNYCERAVANRTNYNNDAKGIFIDNRTTTCLCRRNIVVDCWGIGWREGYYIANGAYPSIEMPDAVGGGIAYYEGMYSQVYSNIIIGCRYGIEWGSAMEVGNIASNNLIVNCTGGAFYQMVALRIYTQFMLLIANNLAINSGAEFSGTASTVKMLTNVSATERTDIDISELMSDYAAGTITSAKFNEYFRHHAGSDLIGTGSFVANYSDSNERKYEVPPSIGPTEYYETSPRALRLP